jgi:hypothetical protein
MRTIRLKFMPDRYIMGTPANLARAAVESYIVFSLVLHR